jgi:uncharacterized protein YbjT (DUF2867 family)
MLQTALILEYLKREPDAVRIRVTARRPEQVATFQQLGQDAVLLDLDSPATFAAALCGVDRVFLLTGYTVAMLAQSKTFIDAARKARIQHLVHLGVFGHWDCTDPHLVWQWRQPETTTLRTGMPLRLSSS